MLELTIHDGSREVVLQFEHSLRSVSKWESKHRKPFLSKERTVLEMIDYYKEMILTEGADPNLVYGMSPEQLEQLAKYINEPQTASSVPREPGIQQETVTSELMYYWIAELNIDWEVQDWHLSRLLMLVQIANYKKQPAKKQSPGKFQASWQAANEAAKRRFNSNG